MTDMAVALSAGTVVAVVAAAWGDLKRSVIGNRERDEMWRAMHERADDAKHDQNTVTLAEHTHTMAEHTKTLADQTSSLGDIKYEMKRINGTVQRHEGILSQRAKEGD